MEDRTGLFNGSGLMLTDGESFEVNVLPSAMMDIVRGRYFYEQFEIRRFVGSGVRLQIG